MPKHINPYDIALLVLGAMASVLVLMLLYLAVTRPKQLFLEFFDYQSRGIRRDLALFSDAYRWVIKKKNKAAPKRKPKKKERLRFHRKPIP